MASLDLEHGPGPRAPVRAPDAGWQARLRLRLAREGSRTRVVERTHRGPLVVQRPCYPEGGDVCHIYVVHPPGGIFCGDELRVRIDVTDLGHGLITTPAATKIHRSSGPVASIEQRLTVSAGATLEWLPHGCIVFDGSASEISTVVVLEQGARFLGWDMLCLGQPAPNEAFDQGRVVQRIEIHREGEPLLIEQLRLDGGGPELSAPWGLAGHTLSGFLLAIGPDGISNQLLAAVRAVLPQGPMLASATRVSDALIVRILGDGVHDMQAALVDAWNVVRQHIVGRAAAPPRIWAT